MSQAATQTKPRRNWLEGAKDTYDVVVIGSGMGGMAAANQLGKAGHSVLLVEHHSQFGGLATWFKRKGGHIFDISLHGFPYGMVKSCRKYWNKTLADAIIQLPDIRYANPQFNFETPYTLEDFKAKLTAPEYFGVSSEAVDAFFTHLQSIRTAGGVGATGEVLNLSTGELFNQHFPGRTDVHRFLLETISFANGSTLEDPALAYAIVFGNFLSKGIFTFRPGTDWLVGEMIKELEANGVDCRRRCKAERILAENGKVSGIVINGQTIRCRAAVSNAGLKQTIFKLAGEGAFTGEDADAFLKDAAAVRPNTASCQVYIGFKKGIELPHIGDIVFTSAAESFSSAELVSRNTTSRSYSVYYPNTRPHLKQPYCSIVASLNATYTDWSPEALDEAAYKKEKQRLCTEAIDGLRPLLPNINDMVDWVEAATPRTVEHYTFQPSSFGTKFEGIAVSKNLPQQLPGCYHAGSVGIIMSGWLGTMNYGVLVSNQVDSYLRI